MPQQTPLTPVPGRIYRRDNGRTIKVMSVFGRGRWRRVSYRDQTTIDKSVHITRFRGWNCVDVTDELARVAGRKV